MKKIAIVLSVMASVLVLASCASKGTASGASDIQASAMPAHHDYKGEMGKKK